MRRRRGVSIEWSQRLAAAGVAFLFAFCGAAAQAQGLIPQRFFNDPVEPGGQAAIEANVLTIESETGLIVAEGDVVYTYQGYTARGERLIYNRDTGDLRFDGPSYIRDPAGNVLEGQDLEVTDKLKTAFIDALTITTYDGARITADSAEYDDALQTLFNNPTYAPCGECIDAEGRRIGWSVRATRFVQNNEDNSIIIEQPTLEILGFPVAWLPYLWLPDASQAALERVRTPTFDYSEDIGAKVEVPITAYSSRYTDIILTPTLVSGQGFLMGAEWVQRFDNGRFNIKASGVYQMDPNAFEGEVGDREWRGMIQTTGTFRPVTDWVVGWSYTAFTDAGYLGDYLFDLGDAREDNVYATYLNEDTYFDVRLQQFNQLGENIQPVHQERQGAALPNMRYDRIVELGDGLGQLELAGRLLHIAREADHSTTINGVPHVLGFEGEKTHVMAQAAWRDQWIGPMGIVATPYVGARADAASYSGESSHALAPDATSLFSLTPIAAMDVRWPWAGSSGSVVHLVEPVAQLVYRGSGEAMPGITNDNAQSFVFDDTNLFSYDRFSGTDRQETGLRTNVGGRYAVDFGNDSYLELIAGQSIHLAGVNAFDVDDPGLAGATEALADDLSYAVLGAYGAFTPYLRAGGKVVLDSDYSEVVRGALTASLNLNGYRAGVDYYYEAANADAGVLDEQHEVGATIGIPLMDYWRLSAGYYWDVAANTWLQTTAGLTYDDGYLAAGANLVMTGPTHYKPDDTRITASILLKAPAGFSAGYSGAFAP